MKWDEFTAGWLAHALQTFPQDSSISFHVEERMSCRTTSKQLWRTYIMHMAVSSLLKCFTDAACSVHVSQFWFQLFLCFLPLCSCSVFTAEPFCGPSVLPVLVHSTQQDRQCARAPWVFPKLWTSHHFQWSEWDLLIGTLRVCALPHLPVPEQLFSDGAAMAPLCHCITLHLQNL